MFQPRSYRAGAGLARGWASGLLASISIGLNSAVCALALMALLA